MFSRLLNAYTAYGGGFSHAPAGLGNRTAWDGFDADDYLRYTQARANSAWFIPNVMAESARRKQIRDDRDVEKTKLARSIVKKQEETRIMKEDLRALSEQLKVARAEAARKEAIQWAYFIVQMIGQLEVLRGLKPDSKD